MATVRSSHDLPEHDRLHVHNLDVRDRAGAHHAVARAVEVFGRLDVLINNAGYGIQNPDDRLRLLVGDDAPGQVAAALDARLADYGRDSRYHGPTGSAPQG